MDLTCLARQSFDSEALGLDFYRVTRFDYPALARELAELPAPFMADAKLPAQDLAGSKALQTVGFRKACVQPTFVLDLAGSPEAPGGQDAEPRDRAALPREGRSTRAADSLGGRSDLAARGEPLGQATLPIKDLEAHAANFPFSRFGQDPQVTDAERIDHQRKWLANTMASGEILKFMEPRAFVSFKVREGAAAIDLVSVLDSGRGVGSLLLARLKAWAAAKGLARIEVTTESENVRACLFYQKNGFRLARAAVAFHLRRGA